MMQERLAKLRTDIERLDADIVAAIARRVALARDIGAAKRALQLPTLDPAREAAVVRRAVGVARDAGLTCDDEIRQIFWQLIGLSRRAQQEGGGSVTSSRTAPPPASVGIVGLGVVGGSIAKDLAALGVRVLAYDSDPESLERARSERVIHDALAQSLEGIDQAELVIVAVPIGATRDVLQQLAHMQCSAMTDVASTKRGILEAARQLKIDHRFVGAHPLAGDHRAGWSNARLGMFANSTAYLCPTTATEPEPLSRVRRLWCALGARIIELDAAEHDRLLAYSSHLPHIAASALALVLARANVHVTDLGPGGRDVTRIAGASPDMWTTIALENRDALLPAIESLRSRLDGLAGGLRSADADVVRDALAQAHAWTLGATTSP